MNVRLTLDDDLVERVRKIADERGTTLTRLVRQYLEDLTAEDVAYDKHRRERQALEGGFEQF
jgi:predicted transcriptional regulator